MKKLFVSEIFYSIQGEGNTMGHPAVFLRLGGCNLLCGKGDASWECDTIEVWRKGNKFEFPDVLKEEFIESLSRGAHLIITGGEPLIQQEAIANYLAWFRITYDFYPYVEIETNGTFEPSVNLLPHVAQWNCSPKLDNSGEQYTDRINSKALRALSKLPTIFKFVINHHEDWKEIVMDFIKPDLIGLHQVWLMPAASTIDELLATNKVVAQIARHNHVRFCTRLQVEVWNKTTGV